MCFSDAVRFPTYTRHREIIDSINRWSGTILSQSLSHVLIVDDEDEIRDLVKAQLELNGLQVTSAWNAAEACQLLHDGVRPDVVVSDIKLPGMDGFSLLQVVRANPSWTNIPFVLISGFGDKDNLQRALQLGADGFLSKPFERTQLLETLQRSFEQVNHRIAALEAGNQQPPDLNDTPTDAGRATIADNGRFLAASHDPLDTRSVTPNAADVPAAAPTTDHSVGQELHFYWNLLFRNKWYILAMTLSAILFSIVLSKMMRPVYAATSTIRVASAAGGEFDYGATLLATRLGNTYIEIANSQPVLDELAHRLGIAAAPEIKVEMIPETELLEITARDPDPEIACQAANTLAEIMSERSLSLYAGDAPTARQILAEQVDQAKTDLDQAVDDYLDALSRSDAQQATPGAVPSPPAEELVLLEQQVRLRQDLYSELLQSYETARVSEQMRGNSITIVERASLPQSPASPNLFLNSVFGLFGGLVASFLFIVVRQSLNNTITDARDVQAISELPIIGRIPELPKRYLLHPLAEPPFSNQRQAVLMNAFQGLQARIQLSDLVRDAAGVIVLVTSPEADTGKSTVASYLAGVLARSGNRVALVDADLYNPSLHTVFDLPQTPGLGDIMQGKRRSARAALQTTAIRGLRVLTAGEADSEASGSVSVAKLRPLFGDLSKNQDFVIVDAPGLLVTGYTPLLAKQAHAVVLVVSERLTNRDNFKLAMKQLTEIHARVAGIVVNRVSRSQAYSYSARRSRHKWRSIRWSKSSTKGRK
ncbi:MAG: response regulator [Chloroflexi bacterium]|nr:response regulator [Chloroflexota bacterium]